jgi:hypothetical protein
VCMGGVGVDARALPHTASLSDISLYRGTGRPSEEEIGSMLKCAHELYEESASNVEAGSGKRSGKLNNKRN